MKKETEIYCYHCSRSIFISTKLYEKIKHIISSKCADCTTLNKTEKRFNCLSGVKIFKG